MSSQSQLLRVHLYHAARARSVGRQVVGDAETADIQTLLVSLVQLTKESESDPTTSSRWHCAALWAVYAIALAFFHIAEFMITAAFKPTAVSYECMYLSI